jgi:hypothetical protein
MRLDICDEVGFAPTLNAEDLETPHLSRTLMYARLSIMQVQLGRTESVLHAIRNQAVPAFQALPGCRNISVLVDGQTVLFVTEWDKYEQAVEASDAKYRNSALERIQPDLTDIPDTRVYEISSKG